MASPRLVENGQHSSLAMLLQGAHEGLANLLLTFLPRDGDLLALREVCHGIRLQMHLRSQVVRCTQWQLWKLQQLGVHLSKLRLEPNTNNFNIVMTPVDDTTTRMNFDLCDHTHIGIHKRECM